MSSPLYVGPFLHLRTLPAFEGLSNEQLRDLAYEAQEVLLPRGTPIVRRGEASSAMYLIVDGFVEVGPDAVVGPGGVVGFLDVLAATRALAGAAADTDVVAFRIEMDALRDVCEQNFAVLSALLRHVADRTLDQRHALMRTIVGRSTRGLPVDRPLDRVGRIVALYRSPTFPSHSMDALAELAGHLDEVRMERGEALWQPGEAADGFYLVCSGSIQLGGGPWRVGDHLGPGAVPGIVATLADRAYEYEAVASESSVLLHVRAEPFMDVLEDHFEMTIEMLGRMARNLLEAGSGSARPGSAVAEDGGAGGPTR